MPSITGVPTFLYESRKESPRLQEREPPGRLKVTQTAPFGFLVVVLHMAAISHERVQLLSAAVSLFAAESPCGLCPETG